MDHVPWMDFLTKDELIKITQLKNIKLVRRQTFTRIMLRRILSTQLCIAEKQIHFSLSEHGKPYIDLCHFNLSHSHNRALVGLYLDAPVGVDIEHIRPISNMTSIAERYFQKPIHSLSQFFEEWTSKEAYIKALGLPLLENLHMPVVNTQAIDVGSEYRAAYCIMGPSPIRIEQGLSYIQQKEIVLVPHNSHP